MVLLIIIFIIAITCFNNLSQYFNPIFLFKLWTGWSQKNQLHIQLIPLLFENMLYRRNCLYSNESFVSLLKEFHGLNWDSSYFESGILYGVFFDGSKQIQGIRAAHCRNYYKVIFKLPDGCNICQVEP